MISKIRSCSSCTVDRGLLESIRRYRVRGIGEDFKFVQWDQRGAVRTYGKSGPTIETTMTVERMEQTGHPSQSVLERIASIVHVILCS